MKNLLSEKGQGTLEYAIILIFVAFAVITVIAVIFFIVVYFAAILAVATAVIATVIYILTHMGTIFGTSMLLALLA